MRNRRRVFLAAVLALSLMVVGCTPGSPLTQEAKPTPSVESVQEEYVVNSDQIAATNAMGFDLLREINQVGPSQNLFVSPTSVALALSMTANGAAGETHTAILRALRLEDWDETAINEAMAALSASLLQQDDVELAIANSLWLREGVSFKQDFLEVNQRYYHAAVEALDFTDPATPRIIDQWVSEQTRGRIPKIAPAQINPLTMLFIINAVYFKGNWKQAFDPQETQEGLFTLADGSQIAVPMMHQKGDFDYFDSEAYQAVRLPYQGDRLSMIIVLPREGRTVEDLLAEMDAEAWDRLVGSLSASEGRVVIPRFTLSFEAQLNDPLCAMGMGVAFSKDANFSRISQEMALYISEVRHKTFVEVNEEGTEAAGVTSVEIRALAVLPTFDFVADRPFLFAIQDAETGNVLFLGVMRDPSQEEVRLS